MVGRESGGNPLFIDELVRHIQSGEPTDSWEEIGQLDLDEVLWARIQRQPEEARRLLGVVAVSGRPIRQALAFQATELGAGGRVALASLRSARLIRCIGQTQHDEIEIYHDRIRETVVAHLSPDALRWHHERLALVLSTAGPVDPEILAGHFRGCRRLRAAPANTIRAGPTRPRRRWPSTTRRGSIGSRSSCTRGRQPGAAPLEEAGRRTGQRRPRGRGGPGLSESRRVGDRRRDAGAQAAGIDPAPDQRPRRRGLALLRTLLGPLGMTMPAHRAQAQLSLLWHRVAAPAARSSISRTATRARSPPWT